MKTLAIDTATNALSVSLWDQGIRAATLLNVQHQHGILLAPVVDDCIRQVGWKAGDIEEIIVGIGPGSFTGLRIGVSFAKMWAVSKGISLKKVSSLALMAASMSHEPSSTLLIPLMDARRGTAYTGLYTSNDQGELVKLADDCHSDWENFIQGAVNDALTKDGFKKIILIGENIDAFADTIKESVTVPLDVCDDWEAFVHTERAFLGAKPLVEVVSDPNTLVPNYAHATLAETEWAEKHHTKVVEGKENQALVDITGVNEK